MNHYVALWTVCTLMACYTLHSMEQQPCTPHYHDATGSGELPPGSGCFDSQDFHPSYNTQPPPPTEMVAIAVAGEPVFTLHCFKPVEYKNPESDDWDIVPWLHKEEGDEAIALLYQRAQFYVITNKDFDANCLPAGNACKEFTRQELQEFTEEIVSKCCLIPLYVATGNERDFIAFLQQVKALCSRLGDPVIPLTILGGCIKQDEQKTALQLLSDLLPEGARVACIRMLDKTDGKQKWIKAAMPLLKKQACHVDLTTLNTDDHLALQTLCHRLFYDVGLPCNRDIAQTYNTTLDNAHYWKMLCAIGIFWIAAIHITGQGLTITGAIAQEDANKLLGNCTSYSFENSTLPRCVEDPRFMTGLFVTLLGAIFGGPIITVVFFALPLEYAMKHYYRWRY